MKKILFIIDTMLEGGAQKVLLSHCKNLLDYSYEVTLVSLKKSNKHSIDSRIKYIELLDFDKKITTHIFDILQDLTPHVKACDIVVGFSDFIANYIAFTSAKLYKKALLICVRSQLSKQIELYPQNLQINTDLMSAVLSNSHVMVQSEFIKQDMIEHFKSSEKSITIVPNRIQKEVLKPKKLFDKSKKNLVIVGRLTKDKNVSLVLKALSMLDKRYLETLCLHVVGDGDEYKNLIEQTDSFNLGKYVRFYGYKKDALSYIKEADLMVFASRYEGLPNVVLEAFSQKTLVLSSDIKPVKEILKDGENGVLFSDNDIKDLSQKLCYCLDNDLKNLVVNAYDGLHMYDSVYKDFENLLKKVVSDYEKKN